MATAELTLPIDRIKGDPNNIRTKVQVKPIEGLAESIAESGLLQPLVVRTLDDSDDYMVIAGHRRLAAIGQLVDAGRHDGQVPVIIRNGATTDADVTVWQLVENLQREDIDPLDEAAGYMRLLEFDMSQADIARKIGRSRAHVTKRLALLALPTKAQTALRKGDITIERALDIAALDAEDAEEFCKGRLDDAYGLNRLARQQKGKKVAAKFVKDLEATGLTFHDGDIQGAETPDDQHYETMEATYASGWDGTVPTDGQVFTVSVTGDEAMARIYQLVPNTAGKTPDKAAKREDAEKARKKEERIAERAKTDFLMGQLSKVKAKDADDMALKMALARIGFGNAREVCVLLDLEVPVKEETSYDGKTRNVKQYYPLLQSLMAEARADGDIGFLRRCVMAVSTTYGHTEELLELFGYDPAAQAAEAAETSGD
jgi:ParB/RepB/Spo0J family partition protein